MDSHFNIDPYYTPIFNTVDPTENEMRYYRRSRQLIDTITKMHKDQGGTILLSGHAGSIETLTRGIRGRRGRPEYLEYQANKVDYCNFAILERDAGTKKWSVHFPSSLENPYGGQRAIRTSIPLYSATSYDLTPPHLRYQPFRDTSYRYRTKQRPVHFLSSLENPYGGKRSIHSFIPLYSTTHYLTPHHLRYQPSGDTSYRYRYRYR
jgi:broad specificity phosphatase PhoE